MWFNVQSKYEDNISFRVMYLYFVNLYNLYSVDYVNVFFTALRNFDSKQFCTGWCTEPLFNLELEF